MKKKKLSEEEIRVVIKRIIVKVERRGCDNLKKRLIKDRKGYRRRRKDEEEKN